jgi:hypothetical protein
MAEKSEKNVASKEVVTETKKENFWASLTPDEQLHWLTMASKFYTNTHPQLIKARGGDNIAEQCFRLTRPLVEMARKVRAGFDVGDCRAHVPVMVPVTYVDDETGEKVVRQEPLQDCYCPNLPPSDPVNQRSSYLHLPPPDGIAGTAEAEEYESKFAGV